MSFLLIILFIAVISLLSYVGIVESKLKTLEQKIENKENSIETLEQEKQELIEINKELNDCSGLEIKITKIKQIEEIEKKYGKHYITYYDKTAQKFEYDRVERYIDDKKNELKVIDKELEYMNKELKEISKERKIALNGLEEAEKEYILLYQVKALNLDYNYKDSALLQKKLEENKEKQKQIIRNKEAVIVKFDWKYSEREEMYLSKLILRDFNVESNEIIEKVKYSTIDNSKNKMVKVFNQLNKLMEVFGTCYITEEFLLLKIEELELKWNYLKAKEIEKEEQRKINERLREEEKARKELEAEEKKVEKEEKHFINEVEKLRKRMKRENEENQTKLLKQIEELQNKLAEVNEVKANLMNRKMNNKAGYVYVISNKGLKGENTYKVGVTRRLDPMDRINELSSASVPFKYDVHCVIFSDDAFALENTLHKIFDDRRVNKVNKHKEFFSVSLDEIEKVVRQYDNTVVFNKEVFNEEYLLSIEE